MGEILSILREILSFILDLEGDTFNIERATKYVKVAEPRLSTKPATFATRAKAIGGWVAPPAEAQPAEAQPPAAEAQPAEAQQPSQMEVEAVVEEVEAALQVEEPADLLPTPKAKKRPLVPQEPKEPPHPKFYGPQPPLLAPPPRLVGPKPPSAIPPATLFSQVKRNKSSSSSMPPPRVIPPRYPLLEQHPADSDGSANLHIEPIIFLKNICILFTFIFFTCKRNV